MDDRLRLVQRLLAETPEPLSLPLRLDFTPLPAARYLEGWRRCARAAGKGTAPSSLHLYLHVPFCARKCGYCILASRPPARADEMQRFVDALCLEIAAARDLIADLAVTAVHLGGGSPSLLSAAQLQKVLATLKEHLRFDRGCFFAAEMHPRTTTPDKLAVLCEFGIDRVSFGVQTLSSRVLAAVGRNEQTWRHVREAVRSCRELAVPAVNLDLLAGLPGETVASFTRTVRACLSLQTDSLAINRFMVESSPLAACGYAPAAADTEYTDRLMLAADRVVHAGRKPRSPRQRLREAGYGTTYVWKLGQAARGLLEEDTTGIVATLALGHGALSHVHGEHFAVSAGTLDDYLQGWEKGERPDHLAAPVNGRFERAYYATEAMERGRLEPVIFRSLFGEELDSVFGEELEFLRRAGLARLDRGRWRKPASRSFQPLHLLAFLLFSERELSGFLQQVPQLREPSPASHPEYRRPRLSSGADLEQEAAQVDVCLQDGIDEPRLASSTVRTLQELASRHVHPVVRVPVPSWIPADRVHELVEQLADLGVREVRLDLRRALTFEAALSLWRCGTRRKVRVRASIAGGATATDQYRQIGTDMPLSFLWCRISLRALGQNRCLVEGTSRTDLLPAGFTELP